MYGRSRRYKEYKERGDQRRENGVSFTQKEIREGDRECVKIK